MSRSDAAAHYAKAREKAYRIADAKGMYLEVTPAGLPVSPVDYTNVKSSSGSSGR